MTPRATSGSEPMPVFGPQVIWSAFVLAVFGWGVGFYGPPVFLHAVAERTGWPLALVSGTVTLHFLAGALAVANLPALYRCWGVPAVTGVGATALALGVLGWALAAEPWQLLAAALVSGVGWAAMGGAAVNAVISPWFAATRPRALSMAYNGASIGGVAFSPLWVALIDRSGFAAAAALVGTVMLATIWLLSCTVFSRAPDTATAQSGAPNALRPLPGWALWKDRCFLTLAAGMALGLFAQIGLIVHLFSLLVPALGAQAAGLVMGLATACAIAGRSLAGRAMGPGSNRRSFAAASYAVQVAGSLVLIAAAGESIPLLLTGVVLFGLGIGNATSLPPLIAQVEFAPQEVQRVVSLIVAIGQATFAFAPAAFGLLRDAVPGHDATALFATAALVQCLAISSFLAVRRHARRQ